jgi:hypothetical protein
MKVEWNESGSENGIKNEWRPEVEGTEKHVD